MIQVSRASALKAIDAAAADLQSKILDLKTARDNAAEDVIRWNAELAVLQTELANAATGRTTVENQQVPATL